MEDRDLVKLHTHIRNAWIAGCISAAMTLIAGVLGIIYTEKMAQYGLDAWSIVDGLFVAGLAFGIYYENRLCALGLLVYFLVSKIIMAIDSGNYLSLVMGMIFIYFYFRGTVAAFQLRKHRLEAGLVHRADHRKLWYVTGGMFGVLLLAFIVVIVVAALGPDDEVVPGQQLKAKFVREIRDMGLLEKNEELTYFYSNAFYSIRAGSYFFTNKKVVLYNDDWEKASIVMPYSSIAHIELVDDPSSEERHVNIYQRPNTMFTIPLPDKGDDYKKYYELLVKNWELYR
jgi:hypothetical protein